MTKPDYAAIAASCALLPGRPRDVLDLYAASHRAPADYWSALRGYLRDAGAPPLKSTPGERYDLYHDFVLRHVGATAPALRVYDTERGWTSLSYAELDARVRDKASAWRARGVAAGKSVCIVLPFGIDYAVAVLAALALGAKLSPVQPLGARYLANRLKTLTPDFIESSSRYQSMLKGQKAPLLGDGTDRRPGPLSATYGELDACAALFSPLRAPLQAPTEICSGEIHRRAFRDGLALLALTRGACVAAPGPDVSQLQPCLLFAALAAGATFVHLPWGALCDRIDRLDELELRTLGIGAPLRDLLLRAPSSRPLRCQHWFRNPEEPFDWEAWSELIDVCELRKVPKSNLLFDAAAGGAVLCSPRDTEPLHNHVMPAPGVEWRLLDANASGQPARGGSGLFVSIPMAKEPPKPEKLAQTAYLLLCSRKRDYLYAGTLAPRRGGQLFPAAELVELVESLPPIQTAAVVPLVSGGTAVSYSFVLLVFIGSEQVRGISAADHARIDEHIRTVVRCELGERALPDAIEIHSLHARKKKKETDTAWCQTQYLTGALFRKSNSAIFTRLTALRQVCLDHVKAD